MRALRPVWLNNHRQARQQRKRLQYSARRVFIGQVTLSREPAREGRGRRAFCPSHPTPRPAPSHCDWRRRPGFSARVTGMGGLGRWAEKSQSSNQNSRVVSSLVAGTNAWRRSFPLFGHQVKLLCCSLLSHHFRWRPLFVRFREPELSTAPLLSPELRFLLAPLSLTPPLFCVFFETGFVLLPLRDTAHPKFSRPQGTGQRRHCERR